MHKNAMVAGSFDPITKGHTWLIHQALQLAENVTVCIGVNPAKKYHFSDTERHAIMRDVLYDELGELNFNRLNVVSITNELLATYALHNNITLFIRGVRNSTDYRNEHEMICWNRKINPLMTTVLSVPPYDLTMVSSSAIKGLVGFDGWQHHIQGLIHPIVIAKLERKFNERLAASAK